MVTIKIQPLGEGVQMPQYMSSYAAGMDVHANIDDEIVLQPSERASIPTGFALEIPVGYEVQVRPRSGLALKKGITLVNPPGTIDSDFRGEVKIILINLDRSPQTIRPGERIAQMVVAPVVRADLVLCEDLAPSKRGDGGFGHTGSC